ncbi:hypothetical protein PAEN110709_18405 [Paenibacillus endophyticus]
MMNTTTFMNDVTGVTAMRTIFSSENPIESWIEMATLIGPMGAPKGGNNTLKSFNDIASNPKNLWAKSVDDVAGILESGWTKGVYGSNGLG